MSPTTDTPTRIQLISPQRSALVDVDDSLPERAQFYDQQIAYDRNRTVIVTLVDSHEECADFLRAADYDEIAHIGSSSMWVKDR